MCNSPNCPHDPLDDDLSDIFGELTPAPAASLDETRALLGLTSSTYEERCPKCRGTGRFTGYSGRVLGQCFECKGKGTKTFKTSPQDRAKGRASAARSKDRKADAARSSAQVWLDANPAEAEWLRSASQRGFEFAVSLSDALHKYGHLTERQEAAVRAATKKSAERAAQFAQERAERESHQAAVEVAKIAEAFSTARKNRLKYPKLRLAGFTFSLAPDHGRNAGSIYVKDGDTYLGKVTEGRFTRSRDCTAELETAIIAAAADPEAAASAYGLQTGTCSCCGRELTNAESVGLGIGPICREKYGW